MLCQALSLFIFWEFSLSNCILFTGGNKMIEEVVRLGLAFGIQIAVILFWYFVCSRLGTF